jgi:murein DD-endopeptidase MepM/ murein hydrolase activator NlpD
MTDHLQIITTKDEGNIRNLLLSKRILQTTCFFFICLFPVLSVISYKAYHLSQANTDLTEQVTRLNSKLNESALVKKQLALQLNESAQLQKQLTLQVNDLQILNSRQAKTFQEEKTTLLHTAVTELEERSNLIERIMSNIGLDVQDLVKDISNLGGPYVTPRESIGKEVLYRSDRYLESITYLPLGRPVPGPVTSRYGHRTDPVNGKKGYHTGVDMRGRHGQKIIATADGVVTRAFFNGSYGRYIEIDHGNGYTTKFAHMKKSLVKRGDHVKRGQNIGTVGSSGRSTGPHLHYEVCLNGKPVNPGKFMRVDKLTQLPEIPQLTAKSNIKIKHTLVVAKLNPTSGTSEN